VQVSTVALAVPSLLPWGQVLLGALLLSAAGGMLLFRGWPVLGSGERRIRRRA
jgi:uncharacterized membrane protein SpoIIM required for sporulation